MEVGVWERRKSQGQAQVLDLGAKWKGVPFTEMGTVDEDEEIHGERRLL